MTIHDALLSVLADPKDFQPLVHLPDGNVLANRQARRGYPIKDGIARLVEAEAADLGQDVLDSAKASLGPKSQFEGLSDWYDEAMSGSGERGALANAGYDILARLLGKGSGLALDIGCGTGQSANIVRELGYSPVGVDLSVDQLRIASARLPVTQGTAHALPFQSNSIPLAYTTFTTASWGDLDTSLQEIYRILQPGGRIINIGVHPAFNGGYSTADDDGSVVVKPGYQKGGWLEPSHFPQTRIRSRTGGWHWPLADLLNAFIRAGFQLTNISEGGPGDDNALPIIFAVAATKPQS